LGYAQGIVQNKCVFCHSAMVLTLAMNPCVLWYQRIKKQPRQDPFLLDSWELLLHFFVILRCLYHQHQQVGCLSPAVQQMGTKQNVYVSDGFLVLFLKCQPKTWFFKIKTP
jgi:hypothetical protein